MCKTKTKSFCQSHFAPAQPACFFTNNSSTAIMREVSLKKKSQFSFFFPFDPSLILHRHGLQWHRLHCHRSSGLRCACRGRFRFRWRRLAEDDLHDIVPGDVELVQPQSVCQRPSREKPALGRGGHALVALEAALHHAHCVRGSDRQAEVTACGEAEAKLALPPARGIADAARGRFCRPGVWIRTVQFFGALFDHVDGRREAVDWQLVPVPQFVVTFGQSSWNRENSFHHRNHLNTASFEDTGSPQSSNSRVFGTFF